MAGRKGEPLVANKRPNEWHAKQDFVMELNDGPWRQIAGRTELRRTRSRHYVVLQADFDKPENRVNTAGFALRDLVQTGNGNLRQLLVKLT